LGTIPYMAVWMLLLYILLVLQMNFGAVRPRQASHRLQLWNPSKIQAYDTGEQNHCCDLNPLLDNTNTDLTITNVSNVLLQKVPRVMIKIRTCKVTETIVPRYCGHYDHQTMVTTLAKWGVPSKVPAHLCQQWWLNKEYHSAVCSRHQLMVNATTIN
jgi:hypothetical protein